MYQNDFTKDPGGIYHGFGLYQGPPSYQQQVMQQAPQVQGSGMYQDPFGTAMSGTMKGTLQPFINRNTQQASNALYGGLLGYQPQSMVAGDAGGTPQNSMVPQWSMPSAIQQGQAGLLGGQFGNRSWMGGQ